ncbi:hypothetical protein A2U01_0059114 [Trifolium medium]|uniref:Uncharacterized protein n=1 Tax=Trifolium medium TaxID=97028 RepID=A0A392RNS4_9FABA|nr:hypothetical protein [Trifolium medium]
MQENGGIEAVEGFASVFGARRRVIGARRRNCGRLMEKPLLLARGAVSSGASREIAKKLVKEGLFLARGAGSCGASRRFIWRAAPCM